MPSPCRLALRASSQKKRVFIVLNRIYLNLAISRVYTPNQSHVGLIERGAEKRE